MKIIISTKKTLTTETDLDHEVEHAGRGVLSALSEPGIQIAKLLDNRSDNHQLPYNYEHGHCLARLFRGTFEDPFWREIGKKIPWNVVNQCYENDPYLVLLLVLSPDNT